MIALGETEQAAGMTAAARRDYELVGAETRLLQANGVNTDAELALFEADHGDPSQAVDLAARAWAAAPSVRSADALLLGPEHGRQGRRGARHVASGRCGSARAIPPSSTTPGWSPCAPAARERAKFFLSRLVAQSPRFNPLYAPRAERALEGLR